MTSTTSTSLRSRARARALNPSGQLSTLAVGVLVGVQVCALAYYHYFYEGWRETICFAGAITGGLALVLTLLTRRILFSVVVTAAIVTMVVIASDVKRQYMDIVLHAYDVVFYMTSWSTISFLWVDHKGPLLGIVAAFLVTGGVGALVYRHDSSRISRPLSALGAILCAATALWASGAKGERNNTLFYWDSLYLSSFYASWSETLETMWRGQLLEALNKQGKPPFKIADQCTPATQPPHIILIHQESVVPPSYFPKVGYDTSLDSLFKSFDGKLHKLRVETYGGASWLTEFSVLAGVSTYAFGGMRTFVQSLMQGKIRDTLPQSLTRCGYRNSVFYPVGKDFVSNGKFYAAVGMPDIYDYRAQGATRYNERDQFYFKNVLNHVEHELNTKKGPLFSFVLTAATHQPYTFPYEPHVNIPGGAPGTDPEMNEYLRRLGMAKLDYDEFRSALKARFPNERFLLVQYGDHQPVATRTLLGFDSNLNAENVKLSNPDSPGFSTYYAMEGINYDPPAMPNVETLEVPYLGAIILAAARVPMSEAYAERLRLMRVCDGRSYTCPLKNEILGFHRRLMDSGIVDAR
jgi:phosphoglycerol transferase MdoB-like AlkP superfamily enzyme